MIEEKGNTIQQVVHSNTSWLIESLHNVIDIALISGIRPWNEANNPNSGMVSGNYVITVEFYPDNVDSEAEDG